MGPDRAPAWCEVEPAASPARRPGLFLSVCETATPRKRPAVFLQIPAASRSPRQRRRGQRDGLAGGRLQGGGAPPAPSRGDAEGQHSLTGGQHRDTHFLGGAPHQGVLTTPAGSWGPRRLAQTEATSSVSSLRPLCSLGWAPWCVLQCSLWLDPPGHPADASARTGRPPVPTVLGPGQAPRAAPALPPEPFRRSLGCTRFPASPLMSGHGLCEYPCCVFLSRSLTGIVALQEP